MAVKKKSMTAKSPLKKSETKKMATSNEFKPQDILHIDGDDRYAYRWLSVKKLEQNGWQDHRGWEVVRGMDADENEGGSKNFVDSVQALDGTIRRGDLIMARMPKDKAEARNEYFRSRQHQKEEVLNAKSKLGAANGSVEFRSQRGRQVESY